MVDPRRDVPRAIAYAGVGQALMYGVPILAVLVVLPTDRVTSLHGLIDAMRAVFTVYGGYVAADGTVRLGGRGRGARRASRPRCSSGCCWRAGPRGSWAPVERRWPRAWTVEDRGPGPHDPRDRRAGGHGPGLGRRVAPRDGADLWVTRGDAQKYFSAALTVSIALIVLAYLLIFPAFIRLRYRTRGSTGRSGRRRGRAGAWAIAALTTAWSLLAAICLLWPGFGTADPNAALPPGFAGERGSSS